VAKHPLRICLLALAAVPVLTVLWVALSRFLPFNVPDGSLNVVLPLLVAGAWAAMGYGISCTKWPLHLKIFAWIASILLVAIAGLLALAVLFRGVH